MDRRKSLWQIFYKVLLELLTNIGILSVLLFIFTIFSVLKEYIFLDIIEYITNTSEILIKDSYPQDHSYLKTIIIYFFLFFVTFFISQFTSLVKIKYNARIDSYINLRLKSKLSKVHYENYESVEMGEKIKRVSEKIIQGYNSAVESIVRIIEILLYLITYTIFLSKINPVFAVTIILSVLVSGLLVTKMSKHQYKAMADLTNLNQKRDYLNELPVGKETHQEHQSNRLFPFIFGQYRKVYDQAAKGYLKVHLYTIFAEARALILFITVIFLAYGYTIHEVISGRQQIGVLVSLLFIFGTLFQKASSLSYYISNRVTDLLCVSEFYDLLNLGEDVQGTLKKDKDRTAGEIEFRKVSYQYPQSKELALDSVSVRIKEQEKVAIVGVNGSGKTTFSNILLGLISNYEGEVRIGEEIYHKNRRIPIGYIKNLSQDFNLFQITLVENIAMGREGCQKELSKDELDDILNQLGLRELVENLPEGLHTEVGQLSNMGVELSQGQAQKLAAGRLLADNSSRIWILDEPTAYMDPLAEIQMYDFFYQVGMDKTILFISHRLGFAKKADRILVFDEGKIIENGTHEELMKANGKYAQFFLSQMQWYEEKT